MVLFLGISVATALTVGVIYLEVTIDPVELGASPESRSRQEKDYFDKSFTPFYRTEQIILHAEDFDGKHGKVCCIRLHCERKRESMAILIRILNFQLIV